MGRTLLRGGCVLTLGQRSGNHPRADVLIEDDRIVEVGADLRVRDAEVVDAADTIVMPGFVDTHRHLWKTLLRNTGVAGTPAQALAAADAHGRLLQPDDVYAATFVGLLSAVETGITTVVDHADVLVDDTYADAVLQAHQDAGTRGVVALGSPRWADAGSDADLDGLTRRLVAAGAPVERLSYASGHSGELDDFDSIAGRWASARELGLRIHAHAGLADGERGKVAALAARGLLADDVTLVHCARLDDQDLDAIASSGAAVSLTPSADMALGLGAPQLQRFIDRGIRPGLGVDDEVLGPGDLFAQLRAAHSIQHATMFDLKLAGKAGLPTLLTTRDVIRYGTIEGARVAGLQQVTGSLEPGKQADVLVLRTDLPNISPVNDPIGAVVWGMDAANVQWVFVAGRAVVRDGVLDADVERA